MRSMFVVKNVLNGPLSVRGSFCVCLLGLWHPCRPSLRSPDSRWDARRAPCGPCSSSSWTTASLCLWVAYEPRFTNLRVGLGLPVFSLPLCSCSLGALRTCAMLSLLLALSGSVLGGLACGSLWLCLSASRRSLFGPLGCLGVASLVVPWFSLVSGVSPGDHAAHQQLATTSLRCLV